MNISRRFAGYLPVVVDCETGGVDPQNDALLEIAATILKPDGKYIAPGETLHYHVEAFPGGAISDEALSVNQIRPDHPFRFALHDRLRRQGMDKFTGADSPSERAHPTMRASVAVAAYYRCAGKGNSLLWPYHVKDTKSFISQAKVLNIALLG